ncbi:thioredoxin domain-containing protein [Dongia deserti]|uniref:thioredoxin domain-containing protein n=1 Tax=Dongia deserti TaxID=2268030 RepID=UPI000E659ECB|nr:thioredoxin domain-containing protein [Dongia deserti]
MAHIHTPNPNNRLSAETSPYLLQHKDNPVDWWPWGEEALAEAKRTERPILLSVGYAACHWCHVMAHESFEDPEIAALMNKLFVNIKVDREERPDLDQIYQQALALLGQQGGWPLTMFLTPEGRPFWGGTYFPPATKWGRPGFPEVLTALAETYAQEPDKVQKNVDGLRQAMAKLATPHAGDAISMEITDQIARRLLEEVDFQNGGIGQAPKFPQVPLFTLFWRAYKRTKDMRFKDAVATTLTRMCQGGIYDHLGGGFARYAVDANWLVPHFEKMLYDNAELVGLLTLVWQETRDPLYEARVRETVGWLEREMLAAPNERDERAFAASLDADSEGEEGKFYVWTEAEIDAILGVESAFFKQHYDVSAEGNWEEHTILNRSQRPSLLDAAGEGRLAEAREKLLAARAKRVRPGWDDKVLADWNGLMIAALAEAAVVFDEPAWMERAAGAFDFIRTTMMKNGRLFHAWRANKLQHAATLDDHAHLAAAALALLEATGAVHYLGAAEELVRLLDAHFWDKKHGGYFMTADDVKDVIQRPKSAGDSAIPNGNGAMVGVLARLYHLTGEERYLERAGALVAAFSGEINRNFFPLATLINNNEFLEATLQVVVVGPLDSDATQALVHAVRERSLPNRLLQVVPPDAQLPERHPAAGKGMVDGKPAAYVCKGQTCGLPVTHPKGLGTALALG